MDTEAAILKAVLETGPAAAYLGVFFFIYTKFLKPMLDQLVATYQAQLAAAQASNKALQETIDTSIKANTAALIRFESRAHWNEKDDDGC